MHGPIEEDPSSAGEDAASQAFQLVLGRTIAGAEWRRPLSRNWSGTFGVTWQRTTCMDEHGQSITQVGLAGWQRRAAPALDGAGMLCHAVQSYAQHGWHSGTCAPQHSTWLEWRPCMQTAPLQ